MRALCISTHDFDSNIRVGSHYFAKYLSSRVAEVDYVSAPLTPLNFLRATNAEDRQRLQRFSKSNPHLPVFQKRLFSLLPVGPLFPFDLYCYVRNFHYQLIGSRPKSHYQVVYIDNIYLSSLIDTITFDHLIVRVPDVFFNKSSAGIRRVARDLFERADIVISVSTAVQDELQRYFAISSYVVRNGVDLSRFQSMPKLTPKSDPKNVIFVGVFGHWVDVDLVTKLVKRLSNVKVTLIGPISDKLKKHFSTIGAECTGIMSPELAAERMTQADLGIIPFDIWKQRDFVNGISPLKAFEYLAAGIPVVASKMESLSNIEGIELAESHEDFINKVKASLTNDINSQAIKQTGSRYSWENRFAELDKILQTNNIFMNSCGGPRGESDK